MRTMHYYGVRVDLSLQEASQPVGVVDNIIAGGAARFDPASREVSGDDAIVRYVMFRDPTGYIYIDDSCLYRLIKCSERLCYNKSSPRLRPLHSASLCHRLILLVRELSYLAAFDDAYAEIFFAHRASETTSSAGQLMVVVYDKCFATMFQCQRQCNQGGNSQVYENRRIPCKPPSCTSTSPAKLPWFPRPYMLGPYDRR